MASYVFTDKAEHDLEKIIDFTVEHWGALQAMKYIDGFEVVHKHWQTILISG